MNDYEPPAYYVAGQEVKLRGVSWEPQDAPTGGRYTDIVYHVQFPESERTREVERVKVEGGAEALYDDLQARGLLPEWAAEGLVPPWERDDAEGEF